MDEIYFSMIVYVDDDELLTKAIKSIINVSADLRKKIKIIVVDSVCSEKSMDICAEYEKKLGTRYFLYIKTFKMSIGEAYNTAIPEIEGRYVNFSLASTSFSTGSIEAVWNLAEEFERPKLISLAPWTVNEKHEYVQYKMSPVDNGDCFSRKIHLNQEPNQLQLMFHAYFIRCYLINSKERHMWFRPELQDDACMEMLLNLLAEIRGFLYLQNSKFDYTHQLEDNTSAYVCQQYLWWYGDSLNKWILPFVKKWSEADFPLREFMKIAVYYLVFIRFYCNYNNRNKNVLTQKQAENLFGLTGQILKYIDNTLIFKKDTIPNFVVPRGLRIMFLKLKAEASGMSYDYVLRGNNLLAWTHFEDNKEIVQNYFMEKKLSLNFPDNMGKKIDLTKTVFTISQEDGQQIPEMKKAYEDDTLIPVCNIEKEHVIIKAINYEHGNLVIDGIFSLGDFLPKEQINLFVLYGGKKKIIDYSEIYGLSKVFGITYEHKYMFQTLFPVYKGMDIQFAVEINGRLFILDIRTQSVHAHVSANVKNQYWNFTKGWCLQIVDKKRMTLSSVDEKRLKLLENMYQKELQTLSAKGNKEALRALELRKSYFEKKRTKRIWITFDKLYKGGDNGEYIYKYIRENVKDIEIYYVIKGDSEDYLRLTQSEEHNILNWGNDETLLRVLQAEAILDTHADAFSFSGFNAQIMPFICDLFNAKIICIQHGLTVQNIANFQNRLIDNISLYLCASQNEITNLSKSIYGYNQDALKLVGLARYDGLISNDQRQILITPTWRRGLAVSSKMGNRRDHSEAFKNSEYFQVYNKLINDPKLIRTAKKIGYKIIYLLHPVLTAQLCDFDCPADVTIMTTEGEMSYEKILTESSLMVTDYSGVQFDFAYMRKPILYYHPNTLPPHFDESEAYQYQRDAFGPIIDNHEKLVDELCEYMHNHCRMKEEYKARADKFFAFHDFNNCKRIYETAREFMDDYPIDFNLEQGEGRCGGE